MRDVSQQGAERKERQRRQDKPPWHAGQLVAHDNIYDNEYIECRPDCNQCGAERSFVLQLLSRVDDDGWTTRGERSLHGASDEQQGVEKPCRPCSRRTSARPELRDQSLDADDDHEDGEDTHQRRAWQDIIGDHADRKSGQNKCKDAQVLPPVDVVPRDDQEVDVQHKGQDGKDGASRVDAGQEDAERHGQHGAAEAGDPLDEMSRQDDEAKQDSSQGKGHIFLHASSRGALEQYTRNAVVGSSTRAEASAPVRVCVRAKANHTVLERQCRPATWQRRGGTMRLKRAVAIVLTVAVAAVTCAGCRPKAVSTPENGLPSIVVRTVREEDMTLNYSVRTSYPQFEGNRPAGALEKANKAVAAMVLPDIAGVRQNAAHDAAAWAAENPSEAAQWLADHSRFLNADYEIPYLTNDLVSVRIRFETYSGGAHGMSYTRVVNARLSDGEIIDTEGLFLDGKQGLQWLSQYCATDLKRQYGPDYEALKKFVDDGTAPTADNFTSVSLEPSGLVVSFDPYQVGPYAAGPREVHIPAGEVQSMLAVTLSPDAFNLVLEPGD